MFRFFPRPSNSLEQVCLRDLLTAREVSSGNLGVDFDTRVGRDEVVWDVIALEDRDARVHDRIVFPA